jgi:hypothetical protein
MSEGEAEPIGNRPIDRIREAQKMCDEARLRYRHAHVAQNDSAEEQAARLLHKAVMEYLERLLPYLEDEHLNMPVHQECANSEDVEQVFEDIVGYVDDKELREKLREEVIESEAVKTIRLRHLTSAEWQYGTETQTREVNADGPYSTTTEEVEVPTNVEAEICTKAARILDVVAEEIGLMARSEENDNTVYRLES